LRFDVHVCFIATYFLIYKAIALIVGLD
jgi:hypothetical protein